MSYLLNLVLGIMGSVVVAILWNRFQAHQAAKPYAGVYSPEVIDRRGTRPMPGASLIEFRVRGFWSRNPGLLEGAAYDSTSHGIREHVSRIIPDPGRPGYGDRTVKYRQGFEVSQQKIELISGDILVNPVEADYDRHWLRRLKPPLYLD
jgi:hypothetical protein